MDLMNITYNSTLEGDVAIYNCTDEYRYEDGDLVKNSTCLPSGAWSNVTGTCLRNAYVPHCRVTIPSASV